MKPDQERVKNLLKDTVALLCRNGLQFHRDLKVQGLLGITVDDNEVFLVSIDEKIESLFAAAAEANVASQSQTAFSQRAQTQVSLTSLNRSPGSSFSKFSLKSSQRPKRPASRFGFSAVQKRRHRTNISRSGVLNSSAVTSGIDEQLPQIHDDQQQRMGSTGRHFEVESNDLLVQIKKEEDRYNDDVILVDRESDVKMQSDDRAAMLGSYATELSGREAQDLFNEFSTLTTAPPSSSESGGPFVGGVVRNFAASQSSISMSSDQLNSSLPVGSLSWDAGNGSLLPQSQPFTSLPNKTMTSVPLSGWTRHGTWGNSSRHQQQQSGAFKYPCKVPGCDKAFNQLHNLRRHETQKHGRQKSYSYWQRHNNSVARKALGNGTGDDSQ